MLSAKTIIRAWLSLFPHKWEICKPNPLTFGSYGIFSDFQGPWIFSLNGFCGIGAKPLGIQEESHRCQPSPLDGSIAEGMAVLWLLEAIMASGSSPSKWNRLTLAKPSQNLRAIWSFTQGLWKGLCVSVRHCSFVGFSNQGRGD